MPPTRRSRFIDDLVPLIFESHNHWWTRDLIRLSTVSPAWLWAVRKRLYERPSLRSFRACSQLARSLKENPSLRELLRGVDIRPFVGSNTEGVLRAGELEDLRFILSLGGLKSITLGGELAVGAQRFLNMMTKPDAVAELCIDGSLLNVGDSYLCRRRPASFEWDETMAVKFRNLRKLRLSNLELDISFPSVPFKTNVSDISLDNVDMTNGYLHQLLGDSVSSLRHLDVIAKSAADFDEHMKVLLEACSDTLESLHYEVCDSHSGEPLFDHESMVVPSLRRLSLNGVDLDPATLWSIGRCCTALADLSVTGRSVSVTPDQWVEFFNSGALPALETFDAPFGTKYPPFSRWGEPAMAIVRKGLESRGVACPSLGVSPKHLG